MCLKGIGLLSFACLLFCGNPVGQAEDSAPSTEPRTVSLDKALDEFLPRYVWGIGLTPEALARGMQREAIPRAYVSKIEAWITRVVCAEWKPKDTELIAVLGIPKLHYNRDYIIGHFPCESCDAPDKSKAVEFQADDRKLDLTLHSASVKVPRTDSWSGCEVLAIVARFLDIPEEKTARIVVQQHAAEVDGSLVTYGRLQCEWDYLRPGDDKQRRWWSDIPFWIMDGRVCVSISTIDWEHGERPPAAVNAGLKLSGS